MQAVAVMLSMTTMPPLLPSTTSSLLIFYILLLISPSLLTRAAVVAFSCCQLIVAIDFFSVLTKILLSLLLSPVTVLVLLLSPSPSPILPLRGIRNKTNQTVLSGEQQLMRKTFDATFTVRGLDASAVRPFAACASLLWQPPFVVTAQR